MVCKCLRAVSLCLVLSAPLPAQLKVLVAGVAYESADLFAPNALLVLPARTPGGSGITWSLGVLGPRLTAEGIKTFTPRLELLFATDITPFKANGSSRIYQNGREAPALEFTDRAYQTRVGLRWKRSNRWRSDVQWLGLKESVSGLGDPRVTNFWARPYAGVGVAQSYRRVASEDILQARYEGIKISGAGEGFFGSHTWWRGDVKAGAGVRLGRLFLRGQAAAFDGHGLNVVSRFLVGGCWDTEEGLPLYGFRYAQFRLDRGAVANAGADVRIRGNWEAGIRGSYLGSPEKRARGVAAKLGTVWNGIGLHAGVGVPGRASGEAARGGAFLFADAEFGSAWR